MHAGLKLGMKAGSIVAGVHTRDGDIKLTPFRTHVYLVKWTNNTHKKESGTRLVSTRAFLLDL